MPTTNEAPSRGFTLSDFTDIPNPPADDLPAGADAPVKQMPVADAGSSATIEEPEIKPLVGDDDGADAGGDDKPAADASGDDDEVPAHGSLSDALRQSPEDAKAADAEKKAAADKKTADEAAAKALSETNPAKAAEDSAAKSASEQRDSDLKTDTAAHTSPKTRKIITDFQAKTKAARDERDRAAAEVTALKRERDELLEKVKAAPVTKEIDEEVKALRERVRELDISRDPIIQQKYDRKIESNNKSIIDTLKAQGFGIVVDPDTQRTVENPNAIAELMAGGLTLKALNPLLKKLEEAELIDEADAIREAIRQNKQLGAEKNQEIESWKADHSKRVSAREQQTNQQIEQRQAAFREQTDVQYRSAVEAMAKDLPFLKKPAEPLPTDTPAVAKAKQTALDEYAAASKKIEDEVRTLNPDGVPPEKMPEIVGRINSNAILAITLKNHVLPRLMREQTASAARIKQLESELEKIRGAGKLSRLQAGGGGGDQSAHHGSSEPTSIEQALAMAQPPGSVG